MPPQYKPGEVEIVRKVLEEVESVFLLSGFASTANFLHDRINSLESVKEKWEPEQDTLYWFITSYGEADEIGNVNDSTDQKRIKIGNCFPDKASCEVAAAKFIKMLED